MFKKYYLASLSVMVCLGLQLNADCSTEVEYEIAPSNDAWQEADLLAEKDFFPPEGGAEGNLPLGVDPDLTLPGAPAAGERRSQKDFYPDASSGTSSGSKSPDFVPNPNTKKNKTKAPSTGKDFFPPEDD